MVTITEEERQILKIYAQEGMPRTVALADLTSCLEFISDKEIWKTTYALAEKLDAMTDEEFGSQVLQESLIDP